MASSARLRSHIPPVPPPTIPAIPGISELGHVSSLTSAAGQRDAPRKVEVAKSQVRFSLVGGIPWNAE